MSRIRILLFLLPALACATTQHSDTASAHAASATDTLPTTGGYTGTFNNDDQGHADFCVRLRAPSVALRYADGSETGFSLTPEMLVPNPGSGVWCPERGMARLDAREIVTAANGAPMLFHRGGWGFAGNDPASAVHYGHVLLSELDSSGVRYVRAAPISKLEPAPHGHWVAGPTQPWTGPGQQAGNGTACDSLSPEMSSVVVQSIPPDMKYLNSAQTAAIPYAIYGSPSTDLGPAADRSRGIRYTMLTWSWINVHGGGVARALVRNGERFRRCLDVPAIRLASVRDAQTKTHTGWVEAAYGAIPAGHEQLLYGWLISAHRHGSDAVVRHLSP